MDFSSRARHAFGYAARFFKGHEAKFTLLNAYSLGNHSTEIRMAALENRTRRDSRTRLRTELLAIRRRKCYSHLCLSARSEFGEPGRVIDAFTRSQPVDCLVMGTRSHDYVKKIYARRYAADALPKVDCPVLLVPEGVPLAHPENIVVFTDTSVHHSRAICAQLRSLLGNPHADIQLLDLPMEQEISWRQEFGSRLYSGFGDLSLLQSLFRRKAPAKDIEQLLSFHTPDLLVLPHPRSAGAAALPQLHWQSRIPVLLMP